MTPPEKIDLDGILLRRWTPGDTGLMVAAALESFEHLHAWMPWAAEPATLEAQREYVDGSVQRWNEGTAFEYGVFDQGGDTLLGGVGLHGRIGPGGWEIGLLGRDRTAT